MEAVSTFVTETHIAALCRIDPIFLTLKDRVGIPPAWQRETGFISIVQIILEQQVSLDSARACFARLSSYTDISPDALTRLEDHEWRACGVSRQKARYIVSLCDSVRDKSLDINALTHYNDAEVIAHMTRIKGIGPWSAQVYLLFCLQRSDIFPPGDIALINTMIELDLADKSNYLKVAERWQPYRSLAAFWLWHYYLTTRGRVW